LRVLHQLLPPWLPIEEEGNGPKTVTTWNCWWAHKDSNLGPAEPLIEVKAVFVAAAFYTIATCTSAD
jgi:hypothetical protein